jgi:phthalate 4,5-dioxygenase oxygenase subunit
MLTREENQLLCQVGPSSPMGAYLREFWTPALRAQKLEADGAPARVRLFGENFVAFRATDGRVGFFDEGCPHRCTSLALARNEDNALTCIFHGWKIDVSGKVVDVPSEPPERRAEFAAKVRVRHYPVREAGTVIWVYLGHQESPPPFWNFEFNSLPASHILARVAILHCGWLQGLEGVLDSAHHGILHRSSLSAVTTADRADYRWSKAAVPVFEFAPRPYGFREGALRTLGDGTNYARIREFVFPFYSFIPTLPINPSYMICSVPIDDEWSAQWYFHWDAKQPISREFLELPWVLQGSSGDLNNFCSDMGGWDNLWRQDRRAMKEGNFSGIPGNFAYEDFVVQEAMGPIVDRTREYLGSSDVVIIRVRRTLLEAVRRHQRGEKSVGSEQSCNLSRLRGLAIRYPATTDWRTLDADAPPPPLP